MITEGRLKMWTEGVPVEPEAISMLHDISKLPIIAGHVAVMPDVHYGKGSCVGSVIPTKGAIVPSFVGGDIGCGMTAIPIQVHPGMLREKGEVAFSGIEGILGKMGERSFHSEFLEKSYHRLAIKDLFQEVDTLPGVTEFSKYDKSYLMGQLGTLGGGNHFISLCEEEGHPEIMWLVIHSGSRYSGQIVASVAMQDAVKQAEVRGDVLSDKAFAWLAEETPEFQKYISALRWAQQYAFLNRELMLEAILALFSYDVKTASARGEIISSHHNYTMEEEHFGERIWVTRKGAVSAKDGQYGIIPQAMGKKIHIVAGKGNADSYCSCAHGAGRTMSRNKAKKSYTAEDVEKDTAGIFCRKDEKIVDEISFAYKDLDAVMKAQEPLVETLHVLQEVVNIKN